MPVQHAFSLFSFLTGIDFTSLDTHPATNCIWVRWLDYGQWDVGIRRLRSSFKGNYFGWEACLIFPFSSPLSCCLGLEEDGWLSCSHCGPLWTHHRMLGKKGKGRQEEGKRSKRKGWKDRREGGQEGRAKSLKTSWRPQPLLSYPQTSFIWGRNQFHLVWGTIILAFLLHGVRPNANWYRSALK